MAYRLHIITNRGTSLTAKISYDSLGEAKEKAEMQLEDPAVAKVFILKEVSVLKRKAAYTYEEIC